MSVLFKKFETIKCECGHEAPIEFSIINKDGNWTCVNCILNRIKAKDANYAILDISKRYRFTIQDIITNESIIVDEDTERKAFKKAYRFFNEKKLIDREFKIFNKIDNIH